MNRALIWLILLIAFGFVFRAFALGPHEVLVLANGSSADSIKVARFFMEARHVPEQNLIVLNLPAFAEGERLEISPDDFMARIWEPAWKAAVERKIEDHVLACVYSVDFPTTVTTTPQMSLAGFTFVRGKVPPPELIERGTYESPLFAGPEPPLMQSFLPRTFDSYAEWLGDEMPMPSIMLGYTGQRGNTVEDVLKCIRNGVKADGTSPCGTVYFVFSDDIRSRCREWEVPGVMKELDSRGIRSRRVKTLPNDAKDVLGLMMGAAQFKISEGVCFRPGAFAEHLTSHAADFDVAAQSKVSDWIKAGASATAGTIMEPFSLWMKFPHARFYVHYAAGCTLIESVYQSVKSPLQLLVIGEPLASPWGRVTGSLRATMLEVEKDSRGVLVEVEAVGAAEVFTQYEALIDGVIVARSGAPRFHVPDVRPGHHKLRVVAKTGGAVRRQIFVEKEIAAFAESGSRDE